MASIGVGNGLVLACASGSGGGRASQRQGKPSSKQRVEITTNERYNPNQADFKDRIGDHRWMAMALMTVACGRGKARVGYSTIEALERPQPRSHHVTGGGHHGFRCRDRSADRSARNRRKSPRGAHCRSGRHARRRSARGTVSRGFIKEVRNPRPAGIKCRIRRVGNQTLTAVRDRRRDSLL